MTRKANKARTETPAPYLVTPLSDVDDAIIKRALEIMCERFSKQVDVLTSPQLVRDYLRLKLHGLEHEEFWIVYLTTQNTVIEAQSMFRGTLSQTSVYPREIVKETLKRNAGAVILAHNHPSGIAEPSRADELLTQALREALKLIDVKVLDHFIVAGGRFVSFAERGLL